MAHLLFGQMYCHNPRRLIEMNKANKRVERTPRKVPVPLTRSVRQLLHLTLLYNRETSNGKKNTKT